jgi:hypothetical protein
MTRCSIRDINWAHFSPAAREIVTDLIRAGEAGLANLNGGNPAHALPDLEQYIEDAKALLKSWLADHMRTNCTWRRWSSTARVNLGFSENPEP